MPRWVNRSDGTNWGDFGPRMDYTYPKSVHAIVFQQFNLFQNMSVIDNVTIAPIRIKGRDRKSSIDEAMHLLERVGLTDKARRFPDELSGGRQQREAIARALALRPRLPLLGEVTSALDPELVRDVLATIKMLARDGMIMLIVSHEMPFIRDVSSNVVMMAEGRIVESGSTSDIFSQPRLPRTREFLASVLPQ